MQAAYMGRFVPMVATGGLSVGVLVNHALFHVRSTCTPACDSLVDVFACGGAVLLG